jgi:hypothetical protein
MSKVALMQALEHVTEIECELLRSGDRAVESRRELLKVNREAEER